MHKGGIAIDVAVAVAPAAWNPEFFHKRNAGKLPERGWDSITTPGAGAGCDAPRWKFSSGRSVDFESAMLPELVARLKRMGHQFEPSGDNYMDFGSGQFTWRLGDDMRDGYVAASDARRDGQALGY